MLVALPGGTAIPSATEPLPSSRGPSRCRNGRSSARRRVHHGHCSRLLDQDIVRADPTEVPAGLPRWASRCLPHQACERHAERHRDPCRQPTEDVQRIRQGQALDARTTDGRQTVRPRGDRDDGDQMWVVVDTSFRGPA
jgi:hypothetical protein